MINTIILPKFGRRRGFLFTMPLMFGIGIIFFAAVVAISQIFVDIGGPMVPELLSDMPTFWEYDETTGEKILDEDGKPLQNEKTQLFELLRLISLVVFAVIAMGAIAVWLMEDTGVVKKGIAFDALSKVVLYSVILGILPFAWDVFAISIEGTSLYLMNPFDTGDPAKRTAEMWQDMGGVIPRDVFSIDKWGEALTDPGKVGQSIVKNLFLGLFKGIAVMTMTLMMFILSVIRVELTLVIVIAMPIILAVKLVPMFSSVSDMLLRNLAGLCIAPIFSALVLTVGMAYLEAETLPAMEEWFSMLAIGFLAILFPVMLAPVLGSLTSHVGQSMQTAMNGVVMMGGGMVSGTMSGISQASSSMEGGTVVSRIAAGGSAIAAGKMSSDATNGLTSCAGSGIGRMDRFKTFAKAGLMGAAGGAMGGAVQGTMQQAGMPGVGSSISKGINSGIVDKADDLGQNTLVDSYVKNMGADFAVSPNTTHAESFATERYDYAPSGGTSGRIMSSPGHVMNCMTNNVHSVDAGHQIVSNPETRQEFLNHKHQDMANFEDLPIDKQARFDEGVMNHVRQNPAVAGDMLDAMRNASGANTGMRESI